jgi:manganese/zinc/iron transport system substrate-binding protein
MHTNRLLIFVSLMVLVLTACSNPVEAQNTDFSARPIRVTTTTGMISDIVENVGGDRVIVTGLMGPGVDPHLYRASERDVRSLEEADVIFYNGLHLEAGMAVVLERMEQTGRVVRVTRGISDDRLMAPEEFEGAYDPHVWFDVSLWLEAVKVVRDTLIEMDPENAQVYTDNAADYLDELEELDQYVKDQAGLVPESQRVLITAHDAFKYFGRAYGFEVIGLQGISTSSEPGTADVRALADFIVERQIPALFIESSVPRRNIEAVQAAVKAQGFDVIIGGELFSDAMGNPDTPEGTYTGMVKHNIDTIVTALLGD